MEPNDLTDKMANDLTDKMVAACQNEYETSNRLMIECLSIIPFPLPDVAANAVTIAKLFWLEKSASKGEVKRARIDCWRYLDEHYPINSDDPEHCSIRAVICVLYEDEEDDVGDSFDFFIRVLRMAAITEHVTEFLNRAISVVQEFQRGNQGV